jgi:hypothetical protein
VAATTTISFDTDGVGEALVVKDNKLEKSEDETEEDTRSVASEELDG